MSKIRTSNTPVELKGSSFTLSVVHLHEAESKVIHQALEDKIVQAPVSLKRAPVVFSVSVLRASVNWSAMHKAVSATGLRVIGISGCKDTQLKAEIEKMGLPILAEGKEKAPRPAPTPQASVQNTTPVTKTRLIDAPMHFGQRIYAPQCDLIVTNYVNARAELIANDSIHVYDMICGRVLAGASGDRETQILCANLMAELVSTAGEYWLSGQTPIKFYGKTTQLQLVESALTV